MFCLLNLIQITYNIAWFMDEYFNSMNSAWTNKLYYRL